MTLWTQARRLLPILGAAIIGVGISVTAWVLVSAREDRLARQEFTESAADHAGVLQAGLDEYLVKLVALRSFFGASEEVTRREFDLFTKPFLDGRAAGILGFTWIPRVKRDERFAHELAGTLDGIPGYQIKAVATDGSLRPAPERDEYFPVFYSRETLPSRVYGLDLQDGGIRQKPLDRARDSNRLSASENILLQSAAGDRKGFFAVLPVYRRDLPHETVEDRRRNLEGFVQGVFQFSVMVDTILADTKTPLDIFLFDADAQANDAPIHVHASNVRHKPLGLQSQATLARVPHWAGELSAGDKRWRLVAIPPTGESTLGGRSGRGWIVLVAGLLVTGLAVIYMWTSIRDMRRIEAATKQVTLLAGTDALTGLANRRAFVDRLTSAFAESRRGAPSFAVLYLDIDDFKDVNDTLGHPTGDILLQAVVERLVKTVRQSDLVARFGGDEFAILQFGVAEHPTAATLASKINKALALPYKIGGNELRVTASIGISLFSKGTNGPEAMMMQADLALYRAKDDGRNCFRFHTGELDQQVQLRVTLGEELLSAIDRDELELHYQPQVEIKTGRIIGLEALVRWRHPVRGMIMPSIFVPIAERSGAIVAMGRWVLDTACRQLDEWHGQNIAPPLVSVNVSAVQLKRTATFEHDVAEIFARWHVEPGTVELELTESVLMEVSQMHDDTLEDLQQLGASIAIDDFGTGYSSLKYLTMHPVRRLKIAQELMLRVTSDKRSATVVRATIRLAHELGIEVIAEGVETAAQASFLVEAGCGYAQGYYYGRPVNTAQTTELLRRRIGHLGENKKAPTPSAA